MAKCAVTVLLIGIPGAGKSYFASRLAQHFSAGQVISFDAYVDEECDWNENTFKQYRELALHDINQIFTEKNRSKDFDTVLIIDDNMYLKSMRREVYVMARDNNTKLLCIWIDSSLENSIRRNNERTGKDKILEESIFRIHKLFEPPDTTYVADRHFICLKNNESDSFEAGIICAIAKIQELQSESFQLPTVYALEMDRKSKKADEKSIINYVQKIDIFVRRRMSLIQSCLSDMPVEQRKLINKSLCSMKSTLLEIARHNASNDHDTIEMTNDLSELDQKKYTCNIKEYINNNLPQHIALIINEKLE
jgi:tRNA uridine 5-carbamoylmethylation protein Kti12